MASAINVVATIVLILVLIGMVLSVLMWTGNMSNPLWRQEPRKQYRMLIKKIGYPSMVNYWSDGFAMWSRQKLADYPFHEVMLRDQELPHCCPYPHKDCLTISVCVVIDHPSQLVAVKSLSKGVEYDELRHLLHVRCGSFKMVLGVLVLATQMLSMSVSDLLKYWEKTAEVQADLANLMKQDSDALVSSLKSNLKQLNCRGPEACVGKTDCSTLFEYQSVIKSDSMKMVNTKEDFSEDYTAYLHGKPLEAPTIQPRTPSLNPNFKENANLCFMNNQPINLPAPTYDWK